MSYHIRDNLFIGRRTDGSVRLLKLTGHPKEWPDMNREHQYHQSMVLLDEIIAAPIWPGCVAAVSLQGQNPRQFYEAQALHINPPNLSAPTEPELLARATALHERVLKMDPTWKSAALNRSITSFLADLQANMTPGGM